MQQININNVGGNMKRSHLALWTMLIVLCLSWVSYGEDIRPIASFSFAKSSFQVNEPITAIDESYSPIENKITKREWKCVINGKKKTSASVTTLLHGVKKGKVQVYLRVKDSSGVWSEWTNKTITIVDPIPLKLTSFKSEQSTYSVGEKLQLKYTYDNPNDIEIKSQKWRYKNLSIDGNTISGRPRYFKTPGIYEVTLELQDEWGNWSNKLSCKVNVSTKVVERNGFYLFEKGKQGDLIDGYVDKDYNSFDAADIVSVEDIPGTMIMSNSPESIYSSGVLYKDTTKGVGRLLVHHQNRTAYSKKLMVLVSTPEEKPVSLKISNKAIAGPNKHILQTGQTAVVSYLYGSAAKEYTIKPGQTVCIYDSSLTKGWNSEEVVSGTLDFDSTGEITWKVVAMDVGASIDNVSKLQVLARDVHNRGTFDVIERRYVLNLNDIKEPMKLVLGREKEEWLQGIDALTGDTIWNKGNYGLPIKIVVKNNEKLGVVANARGGKILGALKWNSSKVFRIPNDDVLSSQTVAALVGTIDAESNNEIVYMLPNGSSAPILFGFIPKSQWK